MATRTITYRACDGCFRSELHNDIEIFESEPLYRWSSDGRTVDICEQCYHEDKFICRLCRSVHDGSDDGMCEAMRRLSSEGVA